MRGVLTLSILASLISMLAFGGYVMGINEVSTGEEVTMVVSTLWETSTFRFSADGYTALELLRSKHEVTRTAAYIKCIDHVCVNKEYSWSFYVNGKMVPQSASAYTARSGDILEFKFGKR